MSSPNKHFCVELTEDFQPVSGFDHSDSDSHDSADGDDDMNQFLALVDHEQNNISPILDLDHTKKALQRPVFVTPNLSLTPDISSKQIYEHVESLILDHVSQKNQKSNRHQQQPLNSHSINKTLHKLKYLLIPTSGNITQLQLSHSHNSDSCNSKPAKPLKWCTHSTRTLCASTGDMFIPSSALLHHKLYSIAVDKHCGVLRGSVRQDWNTIESDDDEHRNWEELKPHWVELFFDLMFVAAIVHISSEAADAYQHGQYIFILTVFPQFGLLILCWLEQVLYHSRFRMTQTGDTLLVFFYMSLVLMMGLSIGNSGKQSSQKLFLISYMLTKLVFCVMLMKSYFIPRAKAHSVYMVIQNAVSMAAAMSIVLFVSIAANQQWIWTLIYAVLFVYSWFHLCAYLQCVRELGINIPINVPHIAERMGAFVLILLGETLISLMVQHVEAAKNQIVTAYTVTLSFFLIVYCIGKLYFGSQPSEHEMHNHRKSHALSSSVWRARIYKWFHIVLFFGLLGLGLGSKLTVYELAHYKGDKAMHVFLAGIACIIVCICINIIRLTHPFDYSKKHPHFVVAVWLTRCLCILCMFGILFTWHIVHHGVILAVYVACFIVQIVVDFEAQHRLIVAKAADKDKSLHYHKSANPGNSVSFIGVF